MKNAEYIPVIVLIPVDSMSDGRTALEYNIEGKRFSSIEEIQNALCFDENDPMDTDYLSVLTLGDFTLACNDSDDDVQFVNLDEAWIAHAFLRVEEEIVMGLCVEDVYSVAKDLKKKVAKEQAIEILKEYPAAQKEDPSAEWYLVIEDLIYQKIQ